jgi:hypothetical protein
MQLIDSPGLRGRSGRGGHPLSSCGDYVVPDLRTSPPNREAVAAFFLPPTDAARIRDVIDRGERLPRKSTFVWPKPRTGLVLRPLDLDATE